jgi:hypothetical protein
MQTLKKLRIIDIKPNNKFSIITVVNWKLYQSDNEESDIKFGNKPTTSQQQTDTNNKGKKEKNIIYTSEFEKFYGLYPNQRDKQRSFKNWKKCLKENTAEELLRAAENYRKAMEKENRERQYIKSSANFLGQDKVYIDYLPESKETKQPLKMVFREL